MGALLSSGILLNDEFDFSQLFIGGLLGVGCGIQDLVNLAWTCKLAGTWCRAQIAHCSREHIRRIILATRVPAWFAARRFTNDELRLRMLVWEYVHGKADNPGHFCGLWEFGRVRHESLPVEITDGLSWNIPDDWIAPQAGDFICAPMFDQAVRYALGMARTPGLDEADKSVLKRARLSE